MSDLLGPDFVSSFPADDPLLKAKDNIMTTIGTSPDLQAEAIKAGQRLSMPVDTIKASPQMLETDEFGKIDWADLDKNSPALVEALGEVDIGPALRDDIEAMAGWERILGDMGQQWTNSEMQIEQADILVRKAQNGGEFVSEADAKRHNEIDEAFLPENQTQFVDTWREGPLGFAEETPGVIAQTANQWITSSLRAWDEMLVVGGSFATIGAVSGAVAGAPAAGVGAIPGAIGGAVTGGLYGLRTGFKAGQAIEQGYIEMGSAYGEFTKMSDENGELIDHETAYAASIFVGMSSGLIELVGFGPATKNLPGMKLLSKMSKGQIKNLIKTQPTIRKAIAEIGKRIIKTGLIEGLTESSQEMTIVVAGLMAGARYDESGNKIDMASVADRWIGAAVGGIQGGGGIAMGTNIAAAPVSIPMALRANRRADAYKSLGDLAKETKTLERLPAVMRQHIERIQKIHGAVKEVFVNPEKLSTYFQENGVDENQLARAEPELAAAIKEAALTGEDVAIPIAKIAEMARSTKFSELADFIRHAPGEMTGEESTKFFDEVKQSLPALEKESRVYADVKQQLIDSGRAPEAASIEAAMFSSVMENQAKKMGQDPYQFYQSYNVLVRGEEGLTGSVREGIDKLQAEGVPGAEVGMGPELKDFMSSFPEIEGLPAAIEAGFFEQFAGEAVTPAMVDEIMQMDAPVYSEKLGDPAAIKQADEQRSLAGDLKKLGIDTSKMSVDEIAEEMRGRTLEQGAVKTNLDPETGDTPDRISTRMPSTKTPAEDALTENLIIGLDAMQTSDKAFAHNMGVMSRYPNYKGDATDPEIIAEEMKQHIIDNLLWIHDQIDPETRERSQQWYDGARAITERWSVKYDLPDTSIAGVLAALSPQKDWYMNVSLGERVLDIMTEQQETMFTPEMAETAEGLEAFQAGKNKEILDVVVGGTLASMPTSGHKAMWLRIYDETYNNRGHRVVSPEGGFMDYAKTKDGSNKKTGWGSLVEIGKAVRVIEDPDRDNVSIEMGTKHKVRNFYNNILAPNSPHGDVTIDTHAVAAGLLRPLSGGSKEVHHNFGSAPPKAKQKKDWEPIKNINSVGAGGTYGIYADAYREAAEQRGILARQMQSITWEATRGLFEADWKTAKNVASVEAIWDNYRSGTIDIDQARKEVLEITNGIEPPTWNRPGAGDVDLSQHSSYKAVLPEDGVPSRHPQPADSRTGSGVATGIAEPGGRTLNQGDLPNIIGPNEVVVDISIADIEHGESAMPGGKLYDPGAQDLVKEYADQEGDLPPISLMLNDPDEGGDAKWMIADGSHRLEAAKLRGDTTIKAAINMEDAVPNTYETSDGYKFYELPDGRIVDSLNPESLDMDWPDLASFKEDNPTAVMKGDELGAFRQAQEADPGMKSFLDTTADEALYNSDEMKYLRALREQTKPHLSLVEQSTGADGPRGYMRFPSDRKWFEITLTANADLSTFIHESGHFFLEMMGDIATMEAATDAQRADYATIRRWLGIAPGASISREQHEKFARGFESYMREGRAPDNALKVVFEHFKSWLSFIYKKQSNLNVELTDEVREVMDRLVASDDAIAQAKTNVGMPADIMSFAESMMTEDEYDTHVEAAIRAEANASADLSADMLEEVYRTHRKEWKDQRKVIKGQLEEELQKTQGWQAMDEIRRGKDGGKIDPDSVPDEQRRIKQNKKFMSKVGAPADIIADIYDYGSGVELINAILIALDAERGLNKAATAAMEEKHGKMDAIDIADAATLALHNEASMTMLLTEFRSLAKATNMQGITHIRQTIVEMAKARIAGTPINKIQPHKYRQAEVRAAGEFARMKSEGDLLGAAVAKRQQILAHALYSEARKVLKESESIKKYLGRYTKTKKRAWLGKIDARFRDAVDQILELVEFRQMTLVGLERRKSLADFVQEMEEVNRVVNLPPALLQSLGTKNYKEMSIDELRGIRAAVRNVDTIAGKWGKIIARDKEMDLADFNAELRETAYANNGEIKRSQNHNPNAWDNAKSWWRFAQSGLQKVEFFTVWLDGIDAGGLAHSALFTPLADAQHARDDMLDEFGRTVIEPLRNMNDKQKAKMAANHLLPNGKKIRGHEVLTIALNLGNAENRRKLFEGYKNEGWDEATMTQWMDDWMDKEDWELVQLVWDEIDTLYEPFSQVVERATGTPLPKVQALELKTRHGTFKGGYYPVVYDPKRMSKAQRNEEKKATLGSFENSFASPKARAGASHGRTDYVGPIKLDIDVIGNHIREVVHYITHFDAVVQVNDIIESDAFKETVDQTLGPEYTNRFRPWLQAIANDALPHHEFEIAGWIIGKVVKGTTVAVMGYNMSTMAKQWLGILTTFDSLGVGGTIKGLYKAWPRNMSRDKWKVTAENWDFALQNSGELRHLVQNQSRDVRDIMAGQWKEVVGGPIGKGHHYMATHAFHAMGMAQMVVNMSTWWGAFEKAQNLPQLKTEKQRFDYADAIVRRTQSAGGMKDQSATQRQKYLKMFTMFMSFFSTLHSLISDATREYSRDGVKGTPRFVMRMAYLVAIPVLVERALFGDNDPDDEEDDLSVWDFISYAAGGIPIFRTFVPSKYDYQMSPIENTMERAAGGVKALTEGEELTEKQIKALLTSVGTLFALPTGVINDIIDLFSDEEGF